MFDTDDFLNNYDYMVENAVDTSDELRFFPRYRRVAESLKQIILNEHDRCVTAYFYGSRIYGLATEFSDLDIFIDMTHGASNYFDNPYGAEWKEQFLHDIYCSLANRGNWSIRAYLPNLSVPLIRATYVPIGMDIDIIVENGIGASSSTLVRHLFDIQPEAKKFFHFIRLWLECNGVKMKTYTLTMLVMFFLQIRNLMPSTRRVQKNLEEVYIDGVEVQFDADRTVSSYGIRKLRDYKDYLNDFFEFYGNFDFSNFISVLDGCSYDFSYVADNTNMHRPMKVSSIFENRFNAAKLISAKKLACFQQICEDAPDILSYYV